MLDALWYLSRALLLGAGRILIPLVVTGWLLVRLNRAARALPLPAGVAESRLGAAGARLAPVAAGAGVIVWAAGWPGVIWLSPAVAWAALVIVAGSALPLVPYARMLHRLRRDPSAVPGRVLCAADAGGAGWPFFVAPNVVSPGDFRRFLGGDLRRVDAVAEADAWLPPGEAVLVPHFGLKGGDEGPQGGRYELNRYLNARIPPSLWEVSRGLCARHPGAVARAWKRFHAEATVTGRLAELFRTAELVQKQAAVIVFAAAARAGVLQAALGTDSLPRRGQLGEWNGTAERVLTRLREAGGLPPALASLADALVSPRDDREGLVARLDPFWTVMERPRPEPVPHTLAALRMLWHVRNRSLGHGAAGWALTLQPRPYLAALHGFLLHALLPLAGMDFGVYAVRDRAVVAVDRGPVSDLEGTDGCFAASLALGNEPPLRLDPYFRFGGGRLWMLHRLSKDGAEYLDPGARAGKEAAFHSASIAHAAFLSPQPQPLP